MMKFQWIPTHSNGFQWKPFLEAPGFQLILLESVRFCCKFHGMENQNGWRSLLSSMSSWGFCQIPSGKSEFCGIPWNFYGKHLAGASAIWVSFSMKIPTFFQGIPMEMVGIQEPPGMIPNGICWNLLESIGIPIFPMVWEFQWIPTDSNRFQWIPMFACVTIII